jgi:hypothetical protein
VQSFAAVLDTQSQNISVTFLEYLDTQKYVPEADRSAAILD